MLSDVTLLMYSATVFWSLVAFFVIGYRKWSRKSSSAIVNDVLVMCLGTAYWMSVIVYTRTLTLVEDFDYLHAWWWPLRVIPVLCAMGMISIHNIDKLVDEHKRAKLAKVFINKSVMYGKESILVVEDYTPTWPFYFRALDGKWDVHFAANYDQAVEKIKEHRYKVVIIDIILNDSTRNGIALARYIKSTYPKTFLIAATGHFDKFPVDQLLLHFNDVLYKSFTLRLLRCTVAHGIVRARRWHELEFNFNRS